MTNNELKMKIVEILKEAMKPIEFGGDREHAPEVHYPTEEEIADAIIAAGIGDTSDLEVRCEVLQRDVDNLTRTVEEGAEELKEAEHRAEVAEMALKKFAENITCEDCPFFSDCASSEKMEDLMHSNYCFAEYLKQAEKELAEEEKDDYQGCFDMYLKQSEKDLAEEKK